MQCKKARSLLTEFIDESITFDIRQSLNAHLEACNECKDELRRHMITQKALKTAYKFNAPLGFSARVMRRLPAERVKDDIFTGSWFSFTFHGAGAKFAQLAGAAVIVLAIAAGIIFGGILSDKLIDLRAAIVSDTNQEAPALSYLEYLDPAPPESLAVAYLAMENGENER